MLMPTLKAGTILVNQEEGTVALIYRDWKGDVSFPKGHLEKGETLVECAIRETEEEVKRTCEIVEGCEPIIERYTTPKGEECECHNYVAIDTGVSDNPSIERHQVWWKPINEVESLLTYDNLKETWRKRKDIILQLIKDYKSGKTIQEIIKLNKK